VLTHLFNLPYFNNIPSATASTIKIIDVMATEPLAATFAPVSMLNPLNVPATTSAKAAITRIQNNQQKAKNNFLPTLPMYSSIIKPIVLPLFLTDAYIEAKS